MSNTICGILNNIRRFIITGQNVYYVCFSNRHKMFKTFDEGTTSVTKNRSKSQSIQHYHTDRNSLFNSISLPLPNAPNKYPHPTRFASSSESPTPHKPSPGTYKLLLSGARFARNHSTPSRNDGGLGFCAPLATIRRASSTVHSTHSISSSSTPPPPPVRIASVTSQ